MPDNAPPGFKPQVLRHVPPRHREDAVQEAWVAYLEGRNPNTAAREYARRELLHDSRSVAISQADHDQRDGYEERLAQD